MLRKFMIVSSICCFVLLSVLACGGSPASDGPNTVHMSNTSFETSSVTIKKGERITLVADTMTPHTISNGTWENGVAKPSTEAGAPTANTIYRQVGIARPLLAPLRVPEPFTSTVPSMQACNWRSSSNDPES
ncbi:hypothetical protein [Ktedonobacter sp. SOSP1-52]|uniref:hypothetical protein n=1 Tax=Ktedonobacter sp. SOSP1-52 TaxID=2778366 RepID=UPI001F2FEAE6|nr:hypothetical protein [Ktedonobacter sp. SOSP1-52]